MKNTAIAPDPQSVAQQVQASGAALRHTIGAHSPAIGVTPHHFEELTRIGLILEKSPDEVARNLFSIIGDEHQESQFQHPLELNQLVEYFDYPPKEARRIRKRIAGMVQNPEHHKALAQALKASARPTVKRGAAIPLSDQIAAVQAEIDCNRSSFGALSGSQKGVIDADKEPMMARRVECLEAARAILATITGKEIR